MKSIEISLGHAAMHSPWLVHAPNPSASICATMFTTRLERSGWPWGRRPRCEAFAATNSIAEALGQAATHAPHPMHAAASIARSACIGCGACTNHGECMAACPKEISIDFIVRLNRDYLKAVASRKPQAARGDGGEA